MYIVHVSVQHRMHQDGYWGIDQAYNLMKIWWFIPCPPEYSRCFLPWSFNGDPDRQCVCERKDQQTQCTVTQYTSMTVLSCPRVVNENEKFESVSME